MRDSEIVKYLAMAILGASKISVDGHCIKIELPTFKEPEVTSGEDCEKGGDLDVDESMVFKSKHQVAKEFADRVYAKYKGDYMEIRSAGFDYHESVFRAVRRGAYTGNINRVIVALKSILGGNK